MKHLPIAALLTTLTACTVGPDYHLPDHAAARASTVTRPFYGSGETVFTIEPLPAHWWRLYESPELDQYVSEGLAANYDLRAAAATLDRASFLVEEAKADRLPSNTLSATGGLSRALASPVPLSSSINLVDYYLVRDGQYSVAALYDSKGEYGKFNRVAFVAFFLGVAAEAPFVSLSFFQGPIAHWLGVDLTFIPALILPGVLYFYLMRARSLAAGANGRVTLADFP